MEEVASALLVDSSLLFNDLFSLQFLLKFAFKGALDVNAGPLDSIGVGVTALPVELVLKPETLVGAAIGVLNGALALLLALVPLAGVDST